MDDIGDKAPSNNISLADWDDDDGEDDVANNVTKTTNGKRPSTAAAVMEPISSPSSSSSIKSLEEVKVKVICLGDSAVGKSKLLERFLQDKFRPQQVSTYALTLYSYKTVVNLKPVIVDFWDTAGQERFSSLHPSYYHQAHACVMVFDATRKITYKNLSIWFRELREHRPHIPCLLAINKIDANLEVTTRTFGFPEKNNIPFHYVSASDGTNVVKLFKDAITAAVEYKQNPKDWKDQIWAELEQIHPTPITKDDIEANK